MPVIGLRRDTGGVAFALRLDRDGAAAGNTDRSVRGGQVRVVWMDQRLSLITLGVSDLDRSRRFYEQLGWQGREVEQTVFFQAGCMVLTLWSREKLALDAGIGQVNGHSGGFSGVVLAHNVRSEGEVTEVITAAVKAGGRVTRPAQATFYGGYAGYFSDPDGHLWEVAYNPGFALGGDGSLTLPDLGQAPS
jgi:predicted lactoylglutathione lyase